jgi:hypothetical protein
MAQGKFTAQVSAWARETKERQAAVFKEAAQRTVEIMQRPVASGGNMPIDTGFLRASLMGTVGPPSFPSRERPDGQAKFSFDGMQINLVIAGAELSDVITIAYTANYARHANYGARGRPGRRFVDLAAQQWPRIVSDVCSEAKARAGS